ncbi:unnamed protein product [Didymodactylos carnosus]|uniref:DUF962 domain-containing protein n=1 Tax=Didymodactylos carnosus TaxID=1234261 RepID=A0A815KKU3_9BILA|nr:unnamed protein product [Didymodactylos carnosus]CAF1397602.1 unnamed protein product [Didymodactylos carnosus]CAF3986096.1 unnamed protein product [Didymodactylos carnosus]CAF4291703.1 unnamed protein product [Didymodactylos carnosus]
MEKNNSTDASLSLYLLKPFFKGDSLANEFGFVNYYHSNKINRILHVVALPFLVIAVLMFAQLIDHLLPKSLPLKFSFVFAVLYCILFFLYDRRVGIAYTVLFGFLWWPTITFAGHLSFLHSLVYAVFILLFAQLVQFIGHIGFQLQSPAFRFFEATVTTPAFLMLHMLNGLTGYKEDFFKEIRKETQQWKEQLDDDKEK